MRGSNGTVEALFGCVLFALALCSCAGSDGHIHSERVVLLQELAEHSVLRVIPTPNTSETIPSNSVIGLAIYLLPDKAYWERRGVCPVMDASVRASLDEIDVPMRHAGGYANVDTCWRGYFGVDLNLPPFEQSTYATSVFGHPELAVTITDGTYTVRYRAPNFLDAITAQIVAPADGTVTLGGKMRVRYSVSTVALPNILSITWPCSGGGIQPTSASLVAATNEIEFDIPTDCPLGIHDITLGITFLNFANYDAAFQAEELECSGVMRCELFRLHCATDFCSPNGLADVLYSDAQTFSVDFRSPP